MKFRISIHSYDSPILVTAIHDGHFIPPSLLNDIHLEEHERMREEDPYTAYLADDQPANSLIVGTSRFITDLNRPRRKCIYKNPEDAWGLQVWNKPLSEAVEKELLAYYDYFYMRVKNLMDTLIKRHGNFVVLDLHSYNHRRETPHLMADNRINPEINIGSVHNYPKWHAFIQDFISFLSKSNIAGHHPDVRENVKFKGGEFSNWLYRHYGNFGCVLSIEFKKTFMDEWTGRADIDHIQDLKKVIHDSIPYLTQKIKAMQKETSVFCTKFKL